MSHAPSLRQIREAIEAHARSATNDQVALESLRQDVLQMIEAIHVAIDRARDFAARGLVSEAASVAEDFPDLARQADALIALPRSSAVITRFWAEHVDIGTDPLPMPTSGDIDLLVSIGEQAARLRPLLDALRVAALRRESIGSRLVILKKLREVDSHNRMWLDQIDALEREWLKRIAEMRTDPAVRRDELEEAFTALSSRQWVAPVPRGLKEEIYARVKPMRAEDAADRYAELAGKIHDAAALMDRTALETLEAQWAQVFHETGRMPDDSTQAAVGPAFEWLSRAAAEERAQDAFIGEVERLERMLDGRAPVADIERQLAMLRDSGRSAPEGVVARAMAYAQAEHDRLRRRHRVVLVASLAAAAVVLAAGVLAIMSYTRARDQQQAAMALKALVDKGDGPAAHALALEILAKPELHSAEVKALLARETDLFAQWNAERALVATETSQIGARLDQIPDRASLKQLKTRLDSVNARVKLPAERAGADDLARRIAVRESELDTEDKARTDQAIAAVDELLKAWPLPDRWTAAQATELARWDEYLVQLERAKGTLERTKLDVAGSDVQESRLSQRIEGIDARRDEARARRQKLAAALGAIAPKALAESISAESHFIERIKNVLESHGETLTRLGLSGAFEASQRLAPAWQSIQAWRELVATSIVKETLDGKADPEMESDALAKLQGFVGEYPKSPYRDRVEALIRRIDPSARESLWTAERVGAELAAQFYSNLQEVPFDKGDRFFYRRPSDADRDPFHRAVENLVELKADPDRLNAYLPKPGEALKGGIRPSLVSEAWSALERALATADDGETQELLLDSLERFRTMEQGEMLFRLRALRDLGTILRQSGHLPVQAERPLEEWMQRCGRIWDGALSVDWVQAAYAAPANIRTLRSQAASAIAEFPNLSQIVRKAREDRARARAELRSLMPIGLLLAAESADGARRFVPFGTSANATTVVLVAGLSDEFGFLDAEVRDGQLVGDLKRVAAGPVLVFRRVGP